VSDGALGPPAPSGRVCIVGGAGFIGSHLVRRLLATPQVESVVVFDNFSSGTISRLAESAGDDRLRIVRGDVRELAALCSAVDGAGLVVHLASNPDIAKAITDPTVDFDQGTYLTHHVLESMRRTGAERILYASGSGVYGDLGETEASEDYTPLMPVSTYGASKLAGEALICAYSQMFGLTGCAFRFGNVVGPRQTHGVGYDFVRRLLLAPDELAILGDGRQSKSYIHVEDVINAVFFGAASNAHPFAVYNVATGDYITVREIAALTIEILGIDPTAVELRFSGGPRGWKGDVPVVRLNTDKIRSLGWSNRLRTRDALRVALESLIEDGRSGRFDQ